MKLLRAAALLLFASPATALAAGPTLVARDVPLTASPQQAASASSGAFTMVGLHWRGRGSVEFRARSVGGRWSGWRPAAPEDEDQPDAGSAERRAGGWRIGNPYWTGPSDRLQVRTRGPVSRVRAYYVRSVAERVPTRALSLAGAPPIVPRLSWGADESIRRAAPSYASSLHFAVVHHTAGSNSYTRAESAAIVRGIQLYHVKSNGWNDIGYNFLVDKYGQVFEGRYGGVDRNVVGAHAQGFNTGSVGVAVLGTYGQAGISAAARDALTRLLAWRLDVGHVDPLSTLSWPSGGNARYPAGVPVFLRAVSGHRDTGFTDCPGNALYAQLSDVVQRISLTGLPKLYEPTVRGAVGGPVRFTARLSTALPWTVSVADAAGNPIASGSGTGTELDWTWDATTASQGAYGWTMDAGPTVLPARGTLGRAAALTVTEVSSDPPVVTPNGDGDGDSAVVSFTLGAPATVTGQLYDVRGALVSTLLTEPRPAGRQTFQLSADPFPDGSYSVVIVAQSGAKQARAQLPLAVNRTLGFTSASLPAISPNGDGRLDTVSFFFQLAAPAAVRARVLRDGKWVANVFRGQLAAGGQAIVWDGRKPQGRLKDGAYQAEITATNALGSVSQRASFDVDTTPPALRLYSLRPVRVRVWEPVRLTVQLNGRWRTIERKRPGLVTLGRPATVRTLRVTARDALGNASAPLTYRR